MSQKSQTCKATNKHKISLKKHEVNDPSPIDHDQFLSLEKSDNITDRLIYMTMIDMLNKITIKEGEDNYIASKEIETEEHKQYILNNWETLSSLFQLPPILKKIKNSFSDHKIHYMSR